MTRVKITTVKNWLVVPGISLLLAATAGQSTGKPGAKPAARDRQPKPQTMPPAGNMARMFSSAMKLYDSAKYQDALVAFDQILKRYPGFEPNRKMIARTLFKLDRHPESWTFFGKIPPGDLDSDTAYEYGFVAFNARQYELSLTAMKRVPDGHTLHDLACYYGGLAALKLKRLAESETLLSQAQVLPDRLARTRILYLKHVQQLQTMQEQNELNKEREAEKSRILRNAGGPGLPPGTRTNIVPTPALPGGQVAAGVNGPQPSNIALPYEHKGFMGISKIVTVKAEQRDQLSDNHGLNSATSNISIGSFKFQQGPFLTFGGGSDSIKDGSKNIRKNAFGVQLLFGGEDRNIKGKEKRIVIIEDDQDLVRILQTDPVKAHKQFAYVGVDPFLEFALPTDWWMQTGFTSYFEYPDFKRLGRSGVIKGFAGIGAKRGKTAFQIQGSGGVLLDTSNKTTTETKEGSAKVTHELSNTASLEVEAIVKDFLYRDESLDGPDQSISTSGLFSYSLGLGFNASIFGAYERQRNAIFHNMPDYNSLSADGDVLTWEGSLVAKPASWLSLGLSQTVSKTSWTIRQEFAEDVFKTNVPDYLSLFKANIAIYFLF